MDDGSSHTTTRTSLAARTKLTTVSEMPAAVSTINVSTWSANSLNALINPACSRAPMAAMRGTPEAAGTTRIPPGPVIRISRKLWVPASTSARVCLAWRPSRTSTLARPKSASSSTTRRRSSARAMLKLTEILLFPTPPLPPETAMTCTGRSKLMCCLTPQLPWQGLYRYSSFRLRRCAHNGGPPGLVPCGCLRRRSIFQQRGGLGHQRGGSGDIDIPGNILPIGSIDDGQTALHGQPQRLPKARTFIQFGKNAALYCAATVGMKRRAQHLRMAITRQYQQWRYLGLLRQGSHLLRQKRIAVIKARGIHQH